MNFLILIAIIRDQNFLLWQHPSGIKPLFHILVLLMRISATVIVWSHILTCLVPQHDLISLCHIVESQVCTSTYMIMETCAYYPSIQFLLSNLDVYWN